LLSNGSLVVEAKAKAEAVAKSEAVAEAVAASEEARLLGALLFSDGCFLGVTLA